MEGPRLASQLPRYPTFPVTLFFNRKGQVEPRDLRGWVYVWKILVKMSGSGIYFSDSFFVFIAHLKALSFKVIEHV